MILSLIYRQPDQVSRLINAHYPAVQMHPITRSNLLNMNSDFVTGFAELVFGAFALSAGWH